MCQPIAAVITPDGQIRFNSTPSNGSHSGIRARYGITGSYVNASLTPSCGAWSPSNKTDPATWNYTTDNAGSEPSWYSVAKFKPLVIAAVRRYLGRGTTPTSKKGRQLVKAVAYWDGRIASAKRGEAAKIAVIRKQTATRVAALRKQKNKRRRELSRA